MEDRETARMRKYGESKTTRIMKATVPHVTSGLGLRKFQADGFLLTRVYMGNNVLGAIFQKTAFFNRHEDGGWGRIHVVHGWETNLQHQSLPIETPTNYQELSYTRRLSRYHAAPVNVDCDKENKHATYKTF